MARKYNRKNLIRLDVRLPEEIVEEIERISKDEALPRATFLRSLIVREIRRRKEEDEDE